MGIAKSTEVNDSTEQVNFGYKIIHGTYFLLVCLCLLKHTTTDSSRIWLMPRLYYLAGRELSQTLIFYFRQYSTNTRHKTMKLLFLLLVLVSQISVLLGAYCVDCNSFLLCLLTCTRSDPAQSRALEPQQSTYQNWQPFQTLVDRMRG